jgi:cobalt-zinc-cadmium efflux system outer membrane protein
MLSENSPLLKPEPRRYSLAETRSLLLYHNPALMAESRRWREAGARLTQAHLTPNPELRIAKEMIDPTQMFGSGTWKYEISQRVELGDKLEARAGVAAAEAELELMKFLAKASKMMLDADVQFARVLRMQDEIEILKEEESIAAEQAAAADALFKGGKITELDSLNRQALVKNLSIMRASMEREFASSCAEMNGMLGLKTGTFTGADGNWSAISKTPSEESARGRIAQHPLMLAATKSLKLAEAGVVKADAYAWPDFSFSIGGAHVQGDQMNQYDYFGFGVMIPIPIADRNEGTRMESRIAVLRAKDEIRAAEKELETGLDAAFIEAGRSLAAVSEYDGGLIPLLQRAAELSDQMLQGGKTTSIEQLQSRLALIGAKKAALMERENLARAAAKIRFFSSGSGE